MVLIKNCSKSFIKGDHLRPVLECCPNRYISQIPQCIRQISHNATLCNRNVHVCAHFYYKVVHWALLDRCIVGFVLQVHELSIKWVILETLISIGLSRMQYCMPATNHVPIVLKWMPMDLTDGKSTFCSGNGLVPSGNKPLPEPMLTQISVAIWRH